MVLNQLKSLTRELSRLKFRKMKKVIMRMMMSAIKRKIQVHVTLKLLPQVLKNKLFEQKIVNIFLPISFNICFGFSKEPPHWIGSFEYPHHMMWLRNNNVNFLVCTLNKRPVLPYSKCYKIMNTFIFLFSNKMLAFRAGIHKKLVRIANREDTDQTLIWVCAVCLSLFGSLKEHLP